MTYEEFKNKIRFMKNNAADLDYDINVNSFYFYFDYGTVYFIGKNKDINIGTYSEVNDETFTKIPKHQMPLYVDTEEQIEYLYHLCIMEGL